MYVRERERERERERVFITVKTPNDIYSSKFFNVEKNKIQF